MPTYEYECKICGYNLEKYLPMDKWNKFVLCPNCFLKGNRNNMIKIPSRVSLGFVNKFKSIEREANEKGRIIVEPGLSEDAKRNKEYKEQGIKRNIRKHVEDVVSQVDI